MKVIKRDGRKVEFNLNKIVDAIEKAINEVKDEVSETDHKIALKIAETIESKKSDESQLEVEQIQDMVEDLLMDCGQKEVAKAYIKYRYEREKVRALKDDLNSRYDEFISLIKGTNEEANKENSNKDTRIIPTMRDYLAGFTCKEMAQKMIIPKDIMEAHNEGIIHFHDMDYSPAMPMTNCCLINLEDMLQNGTVISGTMIEKPKSFRTACTIATQAISQVASSQFGGNSINLAHLVPFIDISRQKIRKQVEEEFNLFYEYCIDSDAYINNVEEMVDEVTEKRLKEEIKDGIQTIQYQLITISTTNG